MALIQSIWLPRRGKKSTMAGTKKTQVLSKGEFFTEYPDSGVGTGHGKAKMGDGVTDYEHLPYFLGDTENEKITFTSNTSTTVAAALNAVVSGATLKNLIAGLKQAIVKCDANVTKLNDDYAKHNHNTVYALKSHTHDDRYYTESEINTKISALQTSFQAGVDTLYNKCNGLGFTPAGKTPTNISNTIDKIYNDRYNSGRTQGQNDVKADPGAFGISTGMNYGEGFDKYKLGDIAANGILDIKSKRPNDYNRLQVSDFLLSCTGASIGGPLGQNNGGHVGLSLSYNPSIGELRADSYNSGDYVSFNMSGSVYLFVPEP